MNYASKTHRLLTVGAFLLAITPLLTLAQSDELTATSTVSEPEPAVAYSLQRLVGDEVIGDFVLSPSKIELEIPAGESRIANLSVSNRIGETHTFSLDVEDMTGTDDLERSVVLLGDDTGPYTLKDYISIPNTEFELDHNLKATIPVTVSVPADAEPGGRYGSVLVRTVTQPATDGEGTTAPGSAIVSRIGALFFVTIPGDIATAGELKDFATIPEQSWFARGPIDFAITYENTGSVHTNPYGEIRIMNMLDEEVGFIQLDPWFVLPNAVRLREVTWDRELLFGRYTAVLKLNRGYDDVVDEMTVTFWVLPWQYVAGAFVGVFILFLFVRGFFRTFEFRRKSSS